MRKGRNVAPISIYASMEETLNDTFNTGTNKELIPSAKPQVKNISPKNAIGTRKLFCSFISLLTTLLMNTIIYVIWDNKRYAPK